MVFAEGSLVGENVAMSGFGHQQRRGSTPEHDRATLAGRLPEAGAKSALFSGHRRFYDPQPPPIGAARRLFPSPAEPCTPIEPIPAVS